ncbi:Phenylalanine-4-hydroxylase (PAH) (Phe-4-monooxygenase) (Tryptophan 5-hydroxylase) (TRH) (Tryptophan 5-monooxygenase) [Durusdinium trenchii]|uniref:phenylalanine 4-monooxygenase n=1 Tax=Durusdinium trenchii TaxID=1381693 RepID=A0ABP0HUV2_9DINO
MRLLQIVCFTRRGARRAHVHGRASRSVLRLDAVKSTSSSRTVRATGSCTWPPGSSVATPVALGRRKQAETRRLPHSCQGRAGLETRLRRVEASDGWVRDAKRPTMLRFASRGWGPALLGRVRAWRSCQVLRTLVTSSTPQSKAMAESETTHPSKEMLRTLSKTFEPQEQFLTSLSFKVPHKPGALEEILRLFWKHDRNLTRIESRPCTFDTTQFEVLVDFEGRSQDADVQRMIEALRLQCADAHVSEPRTVPWFPRHVRDLDSFSKKTLDAGADLESDHPGFSDKTYRARRQKIVEEAGTYKYGMDIPRVAYSDEENATWGAVYTKLKEFFPKYACKEYLEILGDLEREGGYGPDQIPQLQDVSTFLKDRTGFQLRPVAGLLSARDFLAALAHRSFFSTQYIRHHSRPLYTPEPDVVHELMGHAPLLANPEFAELSQTYGLASLGASERDIQRLATCYWFTIEFGLYREGENVKAYGAGLLSSFGEMEYACGEHGPGEEAPEFLPWEPVVAAETEYPITTYQPTYFVAESLKDATDKLKLFADRDIVRPFHVSYLPHSQTIHCDRSIKVENAPSTDN